MHLYKKLDEFGKGYDQQVKEMVEKDTKWIVEKAVLERETEPRSAVATCAEPSPGFKLTIDNVDYHQNVHYMTEDHQNIDRHYVTVNATINRISGTHLSADKPVHGLKDMENGKCIPNQLDQVSQRENYITLAQRILVENIPCLEFGKNVVTKHILHKFSKEASQPTNSVSFSTCILTEYVLYSYSIP
jgi:hypothetical protein